MATVAGKGTRRLSFWAKMSIGLSAFIVFGFAQLDLRRIAELVDAPLVMHAHALAMLTWLTLLVTQSLLAGRGGLALHRKLGSASAILIPLIVVLTSMTCTASIRAGTIPAGFTRASFLATIHIEVITFAALAAFAIAKRRQPDWHKRLMIGSVVILLGPALARTLPVALPTSLLIYLGEWAIPAIQCGMVMLVMRHDRKDLGHIHPASIIAFFAVAVIVVVVKLSPVMPWWIDFTARVTGS